MSELINLSKCYKENNSGGFNLKNINLHFGNVGLVAIVGKSLKFNGFKSCSDRLYMLQKVILTKFVPK